MNKNINELLQEFNGLKLCSVESIKHYFDLKFDGPSRIVYCPLFLEIDGKLSNPDDMDHSDRILNQAGKVVNKVLFNRNVSLIIEFTDKSKFIVSLNPSHYRGLEAIALFGTSLKYSVVI